MQRLLFLKITFILLFSDYCIAQCNDTIPIPFDNIQGTYIGCLDFDDSPDGQGTSTWSESDGTNIIIEGTWKQWSITKGKITIQFSDGQENIYEGDFIGGPLTNSKLHGGNCSFLIKNDIGEILKKEEGQFDDGRVYTGVSMEWLGNMVGTTKYEDGRSIETRYNNINYYDINDLSQLVKDKYIIKLDKQEDTYFINCSIDTLLNFQMVFDTGAEGFRIGKKLYQSLIANGIKITPLGIEAKSMGIGGFSYGEYVKIDELKIGEIVVTNVVAFVSNDSNHSLLGIGLLKKFHNVKWNMKKNELEIIPFEIPSTENGKKKEKKK